MVTDRQTHTHRMKIFHNRELLTIENFPDFMHMHVPGQIIRSAH